MSSTSAPLAVVFRVALTCVAACSSPAGPAADPPQAPPPLAAVGPDAAASQDAQMPPSTSVDSGLGPRDAGRAQGGAPAAASGGSGALGGTDAAAALDSSHGGTITFEDIGAPGFYPSRRDPSSGECTAYQRRFCRSHPST
jgi:hypothetical protein